MIEVADSIGMWRHTWLPDWSVPLMLMLMANHKTRNGLHQFYYRVKRIRRTKHADWEPANVHLVACWLDTGTQMKTLSRHSDTAKAFAYLLKQWDGLNVYCGNGWVEIDNNIAENALRGVAVGRKNWLFAGSDSGGEHAAVLYSLIGTCRLNNVEPEKWLRYVIEHIQDWPANRVRDLLPWKVDLTSQ